MAFVYSRETDRLSFSFADYVSFEKILASLFFVFGMIGIAHHEMWHDEVQVWNIARSSASIAELWQNTRTEGHPLLWHLCVYGLTQLSHNPLSMQIFHVAIATGSVYLIARFSPFTQFQKVLITFGYFSFYEYAVIARSYALGVFLVFLFCSIYPLCYKQPYERRDKQNYLRVAIVWLLLLLPFLTLGLLANTSLYGLFMSVALSVALIWSDHRSKPLLPTLIGGCILGLSWLTCYLQVIRIGVMHSVNTGLANNIDSVANGTIRAILSDTFRRTVYTVSQIWRSYVPIPRFWHEQFWDGNALVGQEVPPLQMNLNINTSLGFVLSIALVGWVMRCLCSHPKWLTVYSLGTALPLTFSYLFFKGSVRHYGHLFILLLACFWLVSIELSYEGKVRAEAHERPVSAHQQDKTRWQYESQLGDSASNSALRRLICWMGSASISTRKRLLTWLLVGQVVGGLIAYNLDLTKTFSAGKQAALFIQSQALEAPILGYPYQRVSPVAAYLDQPLYYPEIGRFSRSWQARERLSEEALEQQIQMFVSQSEAAVILVLPAPLKVRWPEIKVQQLAYVEGEVVTAESFYIYRAISNDLEEVS